jgi:hypothetical protein
MSLLTRFLSIFFLLTRIHFKLNATSPIFKSLQACMRRINNQLLDRRGEACQANRAYDFDMHANDIAYHQTRIHVVYNVI